MIYITVANLDLISYHIYKQYNKIAFKIVPINELEIQNCLMHPGELNETLTEIIPAVYLIDIENVKPPSELNQVEYNVTYFRLKELNQEWKVFIENNKNKVKVINISPEMYKSELEKFRSIFTQEGFDYFWNELCLRKFKSNPNKWNIELLSLLVRKSKNSEKFTVDYLQNLYNPVSSDLINSYLLKLGYSESSKVLAKMTDQQLYTLFIGNPSSNKLPLLYKSFMDKEGGEMVYYTITQLQTAILNNKLPIRIGCLVWNEFIINVGVKKSFKKFEVNLNATNLKRLRKLLHLIK